MKTDAVFKRAFNEMLAILDKLAPGATMPSENALASQLRVSRTTVRKILTLLSGRGVVRGSGRARTLSDRPKLPAPFPQSETVPVSAQLEKRFMEWILRGDTRPGTTINEVELARQFGMATAGVREFLNRFQRFGLIEKRPNAGWLLKGFTTAFALELFELREVIEHRSAKAFGALPPGSPLWQQLDRLRDEHVLLLSDIDRRFQDFSSLDSRFHRLVNSASPNRFIDGFYDVISLIFHYHYQWDKADERPRNEVAIREHLAYIDALKFRRTTAIERACRRHLASAKQTLLRATSRS